MKPNLFAVINGVEIYRVHKLGYGKGQETCTWFSTSGSRRMVRRAEGNCIEHDIYSFNAEQTLGIDSSAFIRSHDKNWLEPFEAEVKVRIAQAIDKGSLPIPKRLIPKTFENHETQNQDWSTTHR